MKRIIVPIILSLVMLSMASPVFAKGKPPQNPGKGNEKQQAQVTTVTPEPKGHSKNQGDKPHGNPHEGRSNFVMFGELTKVNEGDKTIEVTVLTGNRIVQDYTGQDAIIQVSGDATIKLFSENGVTWEDLENLTPFVGQVVRVHGWVNFAPASTETPAAATAVSGVWTARQVYTLSDEAQGMVEGPEIEEPEE